MITPKYTAFDIASYFLFKAQVDQELISNLKLQKLVYFAQGLHLSDKGEPLFDNEIRAWTYGPVVPELYHLYKKYEACGVPANTEFDPKKIDEDTREFLDEVYSVFGQFTAIRLMEITHEDQCWIETPPNEIITHEAMIISFKKYIING